MRRLIRSPVAWMVAAEVLVVGALIVMAWNVVASSGRSLVVPPVVQAPGATDDPGSPLPDLQSAAARSSTGPLPGLNVDPAFWAERLARLNGDQVYLEQLEWRIVHSAEDAAIRYVERVVLPAIQHAEQAGGAAVA